MQIGTRTPLKVLKTDSHYVSLVKSIIAVLSHFKDVRQLVVRKILFCMGPLRYIDLHFITKPPPAPATHPDI